MGESSQTNIKMTNQLKWRLGKLPTPDEVLKLVNDKLITKEEARDILFKEEVADETARDKESLKDEIKFLRELVEKLSSNKSQIVEIIKEVEKPYYQYKWLQPYVHWCSGMGCGNFLVSNNTSDNFTLCGTKANLTLSGNGTQENCAFSSIQTF